MFHLKGWEIAGHLLLGVLISYSFYRIGWKSPRRNLEEGRRVVCPDRTMKVVGWAGILIGLTFLWAMFAYPQSIGKDGWAAIALAFGSGGFLLATAARVRVEWDGTGVIAYRLFRDPLSILWSEVETIRAGWDDSLLVLDREGRKIEMSRSYRGFQEFLSDLRSRVPAAKLDPSLQRLRSYGFSF